MKNRPHRTHNTKYPHRAEPIEYTPKRPLAIQQMNKTKGWVRGRRNPGPERQVWLATSSNLLVPEMQMEPGTFHLLMDKRWSLLETVLYLKVNLQNLRRRDWSQQLRLLTPNSVPKWFSLSLLKQQAFCGARISPAWSTSTSQQRAVLLLSLPQHRAFERKKKGTELISQRRCGDPSEDICWFFSMLSKK